MRRSSRKGMRRGCRASYYKERKEHPSFTKEEIRQIVKDHNKEKKIRKTSLMLGRNIRKLKKAHRKMLRDSKKSRDSREFCNSKIPDDHREIKDFPRDSKKLKFADKQAEADYYMFHGNLRNSKRISDDLQNFSKKKNSQDKESWADQDSEPDIGSDDERV